MSLYLCLDQGGHASRALVLDERGAVVTRALREVATQHPSADRVEHDPEEIVASLRDAAHAAVSTLGARAGELRAAGLATQRSSIVCWDRVSGAALSPVISWQDRRAHAWLAQFSAHADDIAARTGLRLSPHYGASKLRWCLDHVDAVREAQRARRLAVGPLASFLAYRLLDERPLVVDPSNAQRTLLWNLAQRQWDDALLDLFGIPREALPTLVPTHHSFGRLPIGDNSIPLMVLTGDQAAALFAFGEPREHVAYVNLGTGAFVQRVMTEPVRIHGLLTGIVREHAGAATCTLEGTVNGAGAALAWAAQSLGLENIEANLPEWLAREGEPPLFLNGIGGLGAPYWKADFDSRFIGAGAPWQRAVAVVESIVFLLMANLERMRVVGQIRSLVVGGGLASSDGLCQRLANLAALPVWRSDEREATARGLGWLIAGEPAAWPALPAASHVPAPDLAFGNRYRRWCEAMEAAV